MRLLFLLTQLESGGAQTRVVQTVALLRKEGVRADLAFLYEKRSCFETVEKIILAPEKGGGVVNLARSIFRLAKLIRQNRYDAIVTNTAPANIIGNVLAWLLGVPGRIAYQTQPPTRLSAAYRYLDMAFGSVGTYKINIVNSEWTKTCFASYPRTYRSRLALLYDGIVPPPPAESKAAARALLGLPQKEYLVLNIGRLSKQKDQETLIKAMWGVDGKLLIAGEGELRDELEALAAKQLGKTTFLGELPRETLGLYLSAADVFAFSSKWETFGLALVEAASYRLPLVVTNLPVSREVLSINLSANAQVPCEFVEPGNVDGFAAGLAEMAKFRNETQEGSSETCERFTIEYHAHELLEMCRLSVQ